MSNFGHNETAVRLAALAGDAKIALDKVAKGEADAIEGWLAYGAALNEGRALHDGDREFGKWVTEACLSNLDVHPAEQQAAMWAAANADQLAEAKATCNARTLRGWHAQWNKIKQEREAARQKAERDAKAARQREEADRARQEAEAAAKVEEEARAAAAAAETDEERQEAEAKAEEAAAAKAEAEKVVAAAEPSPPEDPNAEARKALAGLTRTGLEDEVIGLRAENAEVKAKAKSLRAEVATLKEQIKDFSGDQAEVIRRQAAIIKHKDGEIQRVGDTLAAEKRKTYALTKRVAELEAMGITL